MHPLEKLNVPEGKIGIHWFGQNSFAVKNSDGVLIQSGPVDLIAPVHLPHGAVVTAAKVYGNAGATGENWIMARTDQAGD